MRIPRIFTPQSLTTGAAIQLEESASRHLSQVLRMQEGRPLIVFNGEGGEFSASIQQINKKNVSIVLGEFTQENRESPLQLELAIGISRGERMDWVLQKATELGVTRIIPLLTERTEVKLDQDRQEKKLQHWQQIIISACEQSQRNLLPELTRPQSITDYLNYTKSEFKFVLHHRDSKSLPTTDKTPQTVSLLIGPEGGLSETEIDLSINKGFKPLTLGPRVLRTETAPLVAMSVVQYLWGDF
jgi:16S rRNA (uracil1498-N3)-methyltransferase